MGASSSSFDQNANVPINRYTRIQSIPSSSTNLAHHRPANDNEDNEPLLSASPLVVGDANTGKKRRNLASFSTLRKRLGRKSKRSSRNFDHSQVLKEFISSWNIRDIAQLVEEYEAESIIKELHLQAEIARPSASTVSQDLTEIFDCNYVADSFLIFKGYTFPVHKAIVCVRCPLFRELLGKVNEFGAQVSVNIDVPGLRPDFFLDLLRYLYSGELYPSSSLLHPLSSQTYDSILMKLSDQVPNTLEHDLKTLFETGLYSDAILVFSNPSAVTNPSSPKSYSNTNSNNSSSSNNTAKCNFKCRACSEQAEFSCHCVVLASRSTFFRKVVARHQKKFIEQAQTDGPSINTANQKIRIVIDESIIPRRFGRILLHCIYRDSTELATLLPGCVCKCSSHSLGQTHLPKSSSNSAHSSSTALYAKEIMELYEIGRFLELDSLIQSCEDMMLDCLNLENLVPLLKWSEQPHGSPWVKRQALCFLREEFSAVASSNILYELEASHIIEAIKSDYLQASELEVLQAVIEWGEYRLYKKMEEQEPNLISQTSHSLRHGMYRREMNDGELRESIAGAMPYVRVGHILPPDSQVLANAIKRGLISTLPPYMLEEDSISPFSRSIACWLKGKSSGVYVKPRYFTSYVEEARNYLEYRLTRGNETIFSRSNRSLPQPDTLYMVEESNIDVPDTTHEISSSHNLNYMDQNLGIGQLPELDDRIMIMMRQRVQELERYLSSSRDLDLIPNKRAIMGYIKLRVVREFGLPDAATSLLTTNIYRASSDLRLQSDCPQALPSHQEEMFNHRFTNSERAEREVLNAMNTKNAYGFASELKLPTMHLNNPPSRKFHSNYSLNYETQDASHSYLSKFTPDIAMTSAFEDMHLSRISNISNNKSRSLARRSKSAIMREIP